MPPRRKKLHMGNEASEGALFEGRAATACTGSPNSDMTAKQ